MCYLGMNQAVDVGAFRASNLRPTSSLSSIRDGRFGAVVATRANLLEPLHAVEVGRRPTFLFTASHGPGVPPRSEHCLRDADIGDDARLHGLVAFQFACRGAGTPAFDQFLAEHAKGPVPIAGLPFVGALPQRLPSHPNGPAIAVYGHVERAWGYSIRPRGLGPRLRPFRKLIIRVPKGRAGGACDKGPHDRFTDSSAELSYSTNRHTPGHGLQ